MAETVAMTRYAVQAGARASDDRLRVILYHMPQVAQVPIGHDLIARLLNNFPGIFVGLKDSAGDLANMKTMVERLPGFAVLAGADPLLLPLCRWAARAASPPHRTCDPTRCAWSLIIGRTHSAPPRWLPPRRKSAIGTA